ncbi:MAG: hypothetical protein JWN46_2354 [Acidimicrobiales bacterium]|nr:hypothetical protein [Acidimicrobiales bacterium]
MADEASASWVRCSLDDARRGKLPAVSVASGELATTTQEAWVKIAVGPSLRAAAAGLIGVSTTYAKVNIPMTEAESCRVPKPRGMILTAGIVVVGVLICFGAMMFGGGLLGSNPDDHGAVLPGAALFFGGVGLITACGRWRYNRNKWTRTRLDFKTGDLLLYAHPAFAAAVAAPAAPAHH